MYTKDSLKYGEKLAREESRFAGVGKGDWAPDHGGSRYRVKTKNGVVEIFDSQLKINKKTGLPRGMKNLLALRNGSFGSLSSLSRGLRFW